MPLSELERKRAEKAIGAFMQKRRPPPHIRPKLDFGYRIKGQSVELFEIRPVWDKPEEKMEHPFAKATYVRETALWKVYWLRADLKWHRYEPIPSVGTLEKFLELVHEDKHACFFG
jgi:hypothetical protein